VRHVWVKTGKNKNGQRTARMAWIRQRRQQWAWMALSEKKARVIKKKEQNKEIRD